MADCDRCQRLESQLKKANERNRQLERRIRTAVQVAAYEHRRLSLIKSGADHAMEKGNLPRAAFGYNRGVSEALGVGLNAISRVIAALEQG